MNAAISLPSAFPVYNTDLVFCGFVWFQNGKWFGQRVNGTAKLYLCARNQYQAACVMMSILATHGTVK